MRKNILILILVLVAILIALGIYEFFMLQRAHSTFDNYYAFRGCKELISKTSNYGYCKVKSGQTIKIVKYQGKWYLDGDLPSGFLSW